MTAPSKPTHQPNQTQATLCTLYDENKFSQILANCECIPIIPRRRRKAEDTFHAELAEYEEGIKYRDKATKQTIAVIFLYTDTAGRTFKTIRSLRIGDIVYDASPHRD